MLVVSEESVKDGKEDGKRAASNEAAHAAKKSKPSPLSADQQAFVAQFKPPGSKIQAKERKIMSLVHWVNWSTEARSRRGSKPEVEE